MWASLKKDLQEFVNIVQVLWPRGDEYQCKQSEGDSFWKRGKNVGCTILILKVNLKKKLWNAWAFYMFSCLARNCLETHKWLSIQVWWKYVWKDECVLIKRKLYVVMVPGGRLLSLYTPAGIGVRNLYILLLLIGCVIYSVNNAVFIKSSFNWSCRGYSSKRLCLETKQFRESHTFIGAFWIWRKQRLILETTTPQPL